MITIERILVPTDFSDGSQEALDTAIEMARNFGARLLLLHVQHVPTAVLPDVMLPLAPDLMHNLEHSAELCLDQLAARVRSDGVACETRLTIGITHSEICQLAEEEGIDLIVIGTHGRGGISHVLLGSVAEKVVRRAPCPVLTVRPRAHSFVHP